MKVLREGLSAVGYKKVETIRSLETVLREMERDTEGRTRNKNKESQKLIVRRRRSRGARR